MTYVEVAMQIILHAGDAQHDVTQAFKAIEKNNFVEAESFVGEATNKITLAHQVQTEMIQGEASGEQSEFSFLFSHAQDTLMTVKMEIELVRRMVVVFKQFDERIKRMEHIYETDCCKEL